MEEFDQILKEIQEIMDKYGVELIVKSEISFKKLENIEKEQTKSP